MTRVYVPRDAAALALGADAVVVALETEAAVRGLDLEIVRNGSRGMIWLEPLVEIETTAGRVAYGPVATADVPSLLDAGLLEGGDHALGHGPTEEIPFLARQTRLTFARCGVTDPLSLSDYEAHGGLKGLRAAIAMPPADVVGAVTDSGLRGRGGAGFPTGIKWRTVLETQADRKYIVCNADEGDSGTFADRMIMEGDPFVLIEGMAIAGLAVEATKGFIYVRSEYPHAIEALESAIRIATDHGILGPDVLGSGRAFDLEVRVGAGAAVCGEA
ncbi:MAG: formate dehydrogenase, partial [Gaiellales bacterium]